MTWLVRQIAVTSAPTNKYGLLSELNPRHWIESLNSVQPNQCNGLILWVPDWSPSHWSLVKRVQACAEASHWYLVAFPYFSGSNKKTPFQGCRQWSSDTNPEWTTWKAVLLSDHYLQGRHT